jgi:hypothetical protein
MHRWRVVKNGVLRGTFRYRNNEVVVVWTYIATTAPIHHRLIESSHITKIT